VTPIFWLRWTYRVVALVVVVVVLVLGVTATRIWLVSRQDDRSPADVAVVLGAAQFDGDPSPVFESRLRHAKELYDEGAVPRIVTTGGSRPGDRFTEAAAGKRFLTGLGVESADVIAVPEGDDTQSSLAAAARAMERRDLASAIVVTDPIHSLRSRTMARDLGMDAWTSPARAGSSRTSEPNGRKYVARETTAYLYYLATQRPGVDAVVR
jgi:vancomycin permeability regulator SanA